MNKHVEFGNGLYLICQEIKSTKKIKTIKEKTNHIWIYDRSYSMSGELFNMTKQMIDLSKKLPKGDTITIGYFSSEGEYRFIIKGFKISEQTDYKFLEETIKNNKHPLGCTCFSEILNETDTVISDLTAFSKVFSFSFFTDGYPVVSNLRREIDNIFISIDKIKGRLTTAMFIGYGHYYNKELMTKMAERIGGMLIHNNNIMEYSNTITRLVTLSETLEPKIEVNAVCNKPIAVYTITDQGVLLNKIIDNKLYVSPESGKSMNVYYVVDNLKGITSKKVELSELDFSGDDQMCKAIYGGALVLCQQMKTDKSMELIGSIGDKYFIDLLTNAFTIEEYGNAENKLDNAINDVSQRFEIGKDVNYLPPKNAFCVFELLNILVEDDEAAFYPYDPRFTYEKISKSTVIEEGYSKFNADHTSACKFNDLTWHKSRLNLSVSTNIKGTIELKERNGSVAKDFGLLDDYPSWVYRTYSFVKDGRPNMKTFYVTTSEQTYKLLKNKGLIIDDTFKADGVYGINISNIPAINREMAEGNTSGKELCRNVYSEIKLLSDLKVYKYFLNNEFPKGEIEPKSFSEEQKQFLITNGINVDRGGSYSPPVKSGIGSDDFYMANRFEIKVKGYSNIPKVEDVLKKINSKKHLTDSESLLEYAIVDYNKFKSKTVSELEREKYIISMIGTIKNKLKVVRQNIQKTKFSIILGKTWFEEFTSRNETTLVVDNNTFNFKLSEEKVKI